MKTAPRRTAAHRPRKRFGQNFLVDELVIHQIVRAIAPAADDNLVEIGPGQGALTTQLAGKSAAPLHVIEIDRDLIGQLQQRFDRGDVHIHNADALRFDFAALPAPLRIVGNLPYNISTPLLFHLAGFGERIKDMTFMLQKEVVERICAPAGSAAYGRLSVMLQIRFAAESLFDVPAEAFWPVPKVTSSIVRLTPLGAAAPQIEDEALFARLVATAFGQRRKTLRKTLGNMLDENDFAACQINPGQRPEELSALQFTHLTHRAAARKART